MRSMRSSSSSSSKRSNWVVEACILVLLMMCSFLYARALGETEIVLQTILKGPNATVVAAPAHVEGQVADVIATHEANEVKYRTIASVDDVKYPMGGVTIRYYNQRELSDIESKFIRLLKKAVELKDPKDAQELFFFKWLQPSTLYSCYVLIAMGTEESLGEHKEAESGVDGGKGGSSGELTLTKRPDLGNRWKTFLDRVVLAKVWKTKQVFHATYEGRIIGVAIVAERMAWNPTWIQQHIFQYVYKEFKLSGAQKLVLS